MIPLGIQELLKGWKNQTGPDALLRGQRFLSFHQVPAESGPEGEDVCWGVGAASGYSLNPTRFGEDGVTHVQRPGTWVLWGVCILPDLEFGEREPLGEGGFYLQGWEGSEGHRSGA